ncbi:MAG: GNAT family N-acetyltransferase [Kineosporiaceae bacterium]
MADPTSPPSPAEAYPAHWEADVVLKDGGTAHLRPITPADADALQAFHVAQSAESTYLRFFAPMPRLSPSDLHRFTHVDHRDRVALICTVGGVIIAVGRFDRVRPDVAEIAFNVADAHQGRGLGSVLLEHLSAAAREVGVHRFVAEVLPQNRRMIQVFQDAGYEVRHQYSDGVLSLEFAIDPTQASLSVMEAREHRAEARSVQALLRPRSLAVVGASRREATIGHRLLEYVLASGYTGRLIVVHPEADHVLGVPAVGSLAAAVGPGEPPIDLVVVAVPAPAVLDVVTQAAAVGARGLVVLSAGFAESGPQGLERQRELVRLAREHGMRVIGPNSWGVINAAADVRLNISLSRTLPAPGRLGLFCQSGALSVAVLAEAVGRGLGLSTFLSAGNRADVSGNDCMQYWEEDPGTDVIGLYLESVGNPRKFSRIARRVSRTKPVVVVTSGASGFGVPPGHAVRPTRAPRGAFGSMLRQSGCIRVENVHQLFDVSQVLLSQPLPRGNRVAVVANSDSLAALLADAATSWELEVVHGPVAVHPQADAATFRAALDVAYARPGVDAVVVAYVPPLVTDDVAIVEALAEAARGRDRTTVACVLGVDAPPSDAPAPVPLFSSPEGAVRSLAAVCRYSAWRDRPQAPPATPAGCDPVAAREVLDDVLGRRPAPTDLGTPALGVPRPVGAPPPASPVSWALSSRGPDPLLGQDRGDEGLLLDDAATRRLLACYGIDVWPQVRVADAAEAVAAADRLGYPVALKTTAEHLRHRVDLGGVRLDVAGPEELRADVVEMQARLGRDAAGELVVQRMAPAGVACVVTSVEDPLFGPVVSFGLAGDASELLGDVAHRIPPLSTDDVADLVLGVRAAPRLFGHRGAAPVDVAALEDVLARVGAMADDLPELERIELNPVLVAEEGAAVLGAVVRVDRHTVRTDAGRRELATG